jgi:hypothetical protein
MVTGGARGGVRISFSWGFYIFRLRLLIARFGTRRPKAPGYDFDTLSIYQQGKEPITITTKTSTCLALSILLDRSNQSGLAKNTVPRVSILNQSTHWTESALDWKLWNQGINENTLPTVVNLKRGSAPWANGLSWH